MTPCLIKAWKNPQPGLKASLHFIIPLAIVAVPSLEDAEHYFLLSVDSCYSLFPLLYEPQEYPIKCCCCCILWQYVLAFTAQYGEEKVLKSNFKIGHIQKSYLMGLVVVEI
ncbi:hypothetical protein IGI04_017097 [Brassica rapa subsp. trilocularis]|uniref:Alpha-1,3-glucosyltransferase n=1 Tax=Brassica rapa subsp. trilocularis TaxID=1813537 RepID=A0ABQ7MXC7_BRACM|nr:hypothetical protein IGI04_017097 [Brassica rapa subsp. trilocularis]